MIKKKKDHSNNTMNKRKSAAFLKAVADDQAVSELQSPGSL